MPSPPPAVWELATGSRPYAGLTQGEIVRRVVVDQARLAFPSYTPTVSVAALGCCIQCVWQLTFTGLSIFDSRTCRR